MSLAVQCIGGPFHGRVMASASRQILVVRQTHDDGRRTVIRYRLATTADGHVVGLFLSAVPSRMIA